MNEGNKENKSTQTKTNLNLHLLGIRGSIEILVPGRLRKAFDLGTRPPCEGYPPYPPTPSYLFLSRLHARPCCSGIVGEQQAAHGVKRRRWAPPPRRRHRRRSRCRRGPNAVLKQWLT